MKTKPITKATLLSILVLAVITAITLNSCQKENIKPKTVNANIQSKGATAFDATANMISDEATNLIFSSAKNEKGLFPNSGDTSACAVRTIDTTHKPYFISYNYGSGCLGSDGKTRSGIISITYNDKDIRVVNNVMTVSYQNYALNGAVVNGGISLTNQGPNSNGNQVIVETGSFVASSSTESDTVNGNLQIEWLAGEFSSPASNWQFSVTGSNYGANSNGTSITTTINTPLIRNAKDPGCNFYIQGTKQIAVSSQPTVYIDYGNPGACSGQQAVTKSGVTNIVPQ